MPDPADQLSLTELGDKLPDNSERLITPKDIRDIVVSLPSRFGRISVWPGGGDSWTPVADEWVEMVAPTWTALPLRGFDMPTPGRLRYIGDRPVAATVTANCSIGARTNDVISIRLGVDGVVDPVGITEIQQRSQTNDGLLSLSTTATDELQPGEALSIFVRNNDDSLTEFVVGHLTILTTPV